MLGPLRKRILIGSALGVAIVFTSLIVSPGSVSARTTFVRLLDPTSVSVGHSDIWVTEWAANKVVEINVKSGQVVRTLQGKSDISAPRTSILVRGQLWVANDGNNSISIFDTKSGKLLRQLTGSSRSINNPTQLLQNGGNVLVLSVKSDCISEINAVSGSLVRKLSLGIHSSTPTEVFGPLYMVASRTLGWVTYTSSHFESLMKVNLNSGAIEMRRTVGRFSSNDGFGQLAIDGSNLYVTLDGYRDIGIYATTKLTRQSTIRGTITGVNSISGLAANGGVVWTVDRSKGTATLLSVTNRSILSVIHIADPKISVLSSIQIVNDNAWVLDQLGAVYEVSLTSNQMVRKF
jgi:hypothetical protein